jgi:hypothetical protein
MNVEKNWPYLAHENAYPLFNLPWLVAREEGLFDKYKVRLS